MSEGLLQAFGWAGVGAFCLYLYCCMSARSHLKSSRKWRERWEDWAKFDFDRYKAEHAEAVKNGVSCRHCGGRKLNMVVQATANASEELCLLGSSVFYGPGFIRYRSHICGTCGKELYRTKGV